LAKTTDVTVPDLGDFHDVPVLEIAVKPGETVRKEQSLITLESDKATLDVPAPFAGVVKQILVSVGDKVSKGSRIVVMEIGEDATAPAAAPVTSPPPSPAPAPAAPSSAPVESAVVEIAPDLPAHAGKPASHKTPAPEELGKTTPPPPPLAVVKTTSHASPAIRRLGRELGVDLAKVKGTGRSGRILDEDVKRYVKENLGKAAAPGPGGFVLPELPFVDFARFGLIEAQPLSRIKRITATHLARAWLRVVHVTQHDEADISELESFRKAETPEAQKRNLKLTMLPFLMKAAVAALKVFPTFNASLDPSGENLILKRYYHLGVAVDTSEGLVVPVIRDVDRKGVFELAAELALVSEKARAQKLMPGDLQGGSFTISSLGGIGGTAFTPIVNAPEVAILGVSRASLRPVYEGGAFVPRLILPLSLSYDHRVIDGAEAVRFTTYLRQLLSDIKRLLL
jgi:pyruvate dehydrogenase E2 component (dihydrolipoamide acetyltransferase)